MAGDKKLFIDADVLVALNDKSDNNHQKAVTLVSLVSVARTPLITSDPAFGEAITVISQNVSHKQAINFAIGTLSSQTEIVEVNSGLRQQGLEIFEKQTSKNSRFTDSINMAIMKNEKLDTIFSFDEHYKKNGFKRFGIDK